MDRKLNSSVPSLLCLCISAVCNGDFSGWMLDRYHPQPQSIADSNAFLWQAQRLFDQIGYPQSNTRARTFLPQSTPPIGGTGQLTLCRGAEPLWQQRGALATFVVGVTGRANSTWQGRVAWVEGERAADFASELELIRWLTAVTDGLEA